MARRLPDALRAPVTDLASGKAWLDALIAADLMFHLEDDPSQIVHFSRDNRQVATFYGADVPLIRDRVARLYGLTWGPDGREYCPIGYMLHREPLEPRAVRDADPASYFEGLAICRVHGARMITDRAGGDPTYDYGAPDRYQLREGANVLGTFATLGEAEAWL